MNKSKTKLYRLKKAFSGWGVTWSGLIRNSDGEWLLIGQLLILSLHLLPAWPKLISLNNTARGIHETVGIGIIILGMLLCLKSLFSLGTNLSPIPKPKFNSSLVTSNSYRYYRHPLYRALIISSIGFVLYKLSLVHLILLISLIKILISKAKREEQYLQLKFSSYRKYMVLTPAIFKNFRYLDWRK
ncbi:methyltransferase family protein [Prochlorococcus sp. MIT 1223]|uniref:methyltransferase family protein n=1 Tax=Prochlorococcus sp. MIT 1223 TaxID=3096217 RepID=UPI002A751EFB|nr:methyltransferase [Prochlorococcus sp. MIT 1223]